MTLRARATDAEEWDLPDVDVTLRGDPRTLRIGRGSVWESAAVGRSSLDCAQWRAQPALEGFG